MEKLSDHVKQEQVREILLMPIVCDKNIVGIRRRGDRIYTGQKYYSCADEDMSDFAMGFYQIIYNEILKSNESIVDDCGKLIDKNFAGDTMNSFKAIANLYKVYPKGTTDICEWEDYLWEYFEGYHCLANFWLLPMDIGRRSAKKNRYDSMDIFLNNLNKDYVYLKEYKSYYEQLSTYSVFCKKHFIEQYETLENEIVIEKYKNGFVKELIRQANKCITDRAENISKSRYCSDLWKYFKKLELIE